MVDSFDDIELVCFYPPSQHYTALTKATATVIATEVTYARSRYGYFLLYGT